MHHSLHVAMILHKLPTLFPWKHNKTKAMESTSPSRVIVAEIENTEAVLLPCKICARTFLPGTLEKHVKICEKAASKKRKTFNSLQQRVGGTAQEMFHQKRYLKKNTEQPPPPTESAKSRAPSIIREDVPKKAHSEEPIKGRTSTTLVNPGELCPSCERLFGPKSYDRHVAWCKESRARKPMTLGSINQEAKERLRARTNYRAPQVKRKKTVKEKYQPSTSTSRASTSDIMNTRGMGDADRDAGQTVRDRRPPMGAEERSVSQVSVESNAPVVRRNPPGTRNPEPIRCKPPRVMPLLNTIDVNERTAGLTVSSLSTPVATTRKSPEPCADDHALIYFNAEINIMSSNEEFHSSIENSIVDLRSDAVELSKASDGETAEEDTYYEWLPLCPTKNMQVQTDLPRCISPELSARVAGECISNGGTTPKDHLADEEVHAACESDTIVDQLNSFTTLTVNCIPPRTIIYAPNLSTVLESDRSAESCIRHPTTTASPISDRDAKDATYFKTTTINSPIFVSEECSMLTISAIKSNFYHDTESSIQINEVDEDEEDDDDATIKAEVHEPSPKAMSAKTPQSPIIAADVSKPQKEDRGVESDSESDCSVLGNMSPRVRQLVDKIFNEPQLETLTLRDCKRILQMNLKKSITLRESKQCEKRSKLPRLTFVKQPKECASAAEFKSTVCALPRIGKPESDCDNPSHPSSLSSTSHINYIAERQLMDLLECDDFTRCEIMKATSPKTHTQKAPIASTKRSNDDDDIDFETLENFINDNFNNEELMSKLDIETISLAGYSTRTTDNNASSYYDDVSIDPRLINDVDNLSLPDNFDTDATTTPDVPLRPFPLTHSKRLHLEPHEPRHHVRIPNSTSSVSSFADMRTSATCGESSDGKRAHLIKKLIPDPITNPKNVRGRRSIEQYLNDQVDDAAPTAEGELFSIDDEMYEEYKRYEQMYLKEKQERKMREAEVRANDTASGNAIAGDSAYGSLNRNAKTKVRATITKLTPMEQPYNSETASSKDEIPHPGNAHSGKLTKFCHECGNRYPLASAKFCVECGVKRLVL